MSKHLTDVISSEQYDELKNSGYIIVEEKNLAFEAALHELEDHIFASAASQCDYTAEELREIWENKK